MDLITTTLFIKKKKKKKIFLYLFWELEQIVHSISIQEFQFWLHASAFGEIHIFVVFQKNIKMGYGL